MRSNAFSPLLRHTILTWLLTLVLCASMSAQEKTSSFEKDLKAQIERLMKEKWAPGAAVVVVRGDETIFLKGYGMADVDEQREVDPDTIFYIASSTKSFTGLAAAILAHRGELDLDQTLDKSLNDASFHADIDPAAITLRELLSHTHGISNEGPVSFRSAFSGQHTVELLKEQIQFHAQAREGKSFQYGNIGYNIAGLVLQNELEMHWKDLVNKEILSPLRMESTTGRVSQADPNRLAMPHALSPSGFNRSHFAKSDSNMHAAGGLVTSATDLANWLKLNINQGQLDGEQLVPVEVMELVHSRIAKQERKYMSFERDGYGLGWNTGVYDGDRLTHHFGGFSGFHCHISFMPEKKIGVAILVNSDSGFLFADVVSRFAYDHLRGVADLDQRFSEETIQELNQQAIERRKEVAADWERRAARPQELPQALSSYAGSFENEMLGRVDLSVVDGKLEARMGPLWSKVETYDAAENQLRIELMGGGQVVTVHFDGQDVAQRMVIYGDTFQRVE